MRKSIKELKITVLYGKPISERMEIELYVFERLLPQLI
jgi:hypothetical protein